MFPFNKNNKRLTLKGYLNGKFGRPTDLKDSPWLGQTFPSPMKNNIPKWFSKQKGVRDTGRKANTIRFCPSYINVFNTGYVIKSPAEMAVVGVLDPTGNVTADISSPLADLYMIHETDMFPDNYPHPVGFSNVSVKFNCQFNFRTNKEIGLMFLPCWWDENYKNVRAIHGLIQLSPTQDIEFNINTQIRMPELNEEYIIPYGTPLAQLIFVNLEDVDIVHDQSILGDDISKYSNSILPHNRMKGVTRNILSSIKPFLFGKGIK